MIQKHPFLIGAAIGLVFVLIQWRLGLAFAAVATVMDFLNAPATWAFDRWYRAGLPPQGNAAFVGPFAAALIQWVCLGSLLGFWFGRRRQKASGLPVLENASSNHEAGGEQQGPESNKA